MEFTQNMQLPIYEENDVTSWLGEYDNAMRTIDKYYGDLNGNTSSLSAYVTKAQSDIKDLQDASQSHSQSIQTLTVSVNSLQASYTNLEARENQHYESLSGEIDAIKANEQQNVTDIQILQRNLKVTRDMAAINSSSINKLQSRVLIIEENTADDKQQVDSRLDSLEFDMVKAKNDINDADALARQANNTANSASTNAQNAVDKVAQTTVTVTMLQTQIATVDGKVDALSTRVDGNVNNIQILSVSVSRNAQEIANDKKEISSLDDRVTTLEDSGADTGLTQRVDLLETWEAQAKKDITQAQATATQANTTANNVQQQVSNVKSGAYVPFSLGIDSSGNYGYIKVGADTVTPFNQIGYEKTSPLIQVNIESGLNVLNTKVSTKPTYDMEHVYIEMTQELIYLMSIYIDTSYNIKYNETTFTKISTTDRLLNTGFIYEINDKNNRTVGFFVAPSQQVPVAYLIWGIKEGKKYIFESGGYVLA